MSVAESQLVDEKRLWNVSETVVGDQRKFGHRIKTCTWMSWWSKPSSNFIINCSLTLFKWAKWRSRKARWKTFELYFQVVLNVSVRISGIRLIYLSGYCIISDDWTKTLNRRTISIIISLALTLYITLCNKHKVRMPCLLQPVHPLLFDQAISLYTNLGVFGNL